MSDLEIKATDSGGDGRPIENDPVIARTVHVCAEADWLIDRLKALLPPSLSFVRLNPTTCAIGSPDFNDLSPADARQHVEILLRNLTALMHIYSPNTRRSFNVSQVHEQHESGRQSAIARLSIAVNQTDGHAALLAPVGAEARATLLLHQAQTDDLVMKALRLLDAPEPGWHAVYDVLEFIEKTLVSDLRKTPGFEKVGQTANHYRHLGATARFPLPNNPPTLDQARVYAFDLLRTWLDQGL